jgi:hypothetical protein
MGCGPEQIDTAEQVLEHRNAGIGGRKVGVVGVGDRQRTWGTREKVIQTWDVQNSVGMNARREIDCWHGGLSEYEQRRGKRSYFQNVHFSNVLALILRWQIRTVCDST